jgi:superfamily I DNA/RNA helicase
MRRAALLSFKDTMTQTQTNQLGPEQLEAVQHPGDLILEGGAGSGKTLVAQMRIAHQMAQQPSKGFLYCAFSRKLVTESKRRFDKMLNADQARRLTVCTQHALAMRIIREHGDRIGFRTHGKRNEPQVIQEDALTELTLTARNEVMQQLTQAEQSQEAALLSASDMTLLRSYIQGEKRLGRMPDASLALASDLLQCLFAQVYVRLQALLLEHNRIDRDDMLLLCAHLLRTFPEIAAFYQALFGGGITMDEAQDWTPLQFEIIQLLAGGDMPLTVVGDPEQTVFSFRGVLGREVFTCFQMARPEAKRVVLRRNYRSDPAIVAFENLYAPPACQQEAMRQGGVPITFKFCADESDEVSWVVKELQAALANEAVTHNEIAILARTRDQLIPFALALVRAGIPCVRVGKGTFWDERDIRFMVACMTLSQDPDDAFAFKRIAMSAFKGLPGELRARLRGEDPEMRRSHLDRIDGIGAVSAAEQAAYQQCVGFLLALGYIKDAQPTKVIEFLMTEAGYKAHVEMASENDRARDERLTMLRELFRLSQEFETISDFLDEIALMSGEDPFSNAGRQRVQLMTLHDAKGSEYEAVFLTGLENDLIPHRMAQATAAVEEELKLFRMAVKRARRFLVVTACLERSGQAKETSIFLRRVEIPKAIRSSITHWAVVKPLEAAVEGVT